MNMNKFTKLPLAFAIICAVTCGIAIAPILVLATVSIVALMCLIICLVIYFFGAIIWLVSAFGINIFSAGTAFANFGASLFTYIEPVAKFCCLYITPYAGFAAIAVGVPGIIISAVALIRAKREPKEEQTQDAAKSRQMLNSSSEGSVSASISLSDSSSDSVRDGGIFDPYSVYNAEDKDVREKEEKGKKNKKPCVKKERTLKGICTASLIVSIVFVVVAVAAIIFSYNCEGIFV